MKFIKNKNGFTLLGLIVMMGFLSVVMLSSTTLLIQLTKGTSNNQEKAMAMSMATNKAELLRITPYISLTSEPRTNLGNGYDREVTMTETTQNNAGVIQSIKNMSINIYRTNGNLVFSLPYQKTTATDNLYIATAQKLYNGANSDYGQIYFESTGNGGGQSALILETGDDGDEEIRVRHKPYNTSAYDFFRVNPNGTAFLKDKQVATTDQTVPSEAVMFFQTTACPIGRIPANGTNGTVDLRGEFVRGLDSGRGVDPGRSLGSFESQAIQKHGHNIEGGNGASYSLSYYPYNASAWDGNPPTRSRINVSSLNAGSVLTYTDTIFYATDTSPLAYYAPMGPETRPRNVALLACVKQ